MLFRNNLLSHSIRDTGEEAQTMLRFKTLPGAHDKDFETEDEIRRRRRRRRRRRGN